MPGAGNVLLLGGSGFLGGRIRKRLETDGATVSAPTGTGRPDLTDPGALRRLIAESRPDAVINAAGITSPGVARAEPAGCFAVNTGGVVNLLEAIRTEKPDTRFVAISSAAVYAAEPPFTETSATAGTTPYAASKLAMEIYCGQYARSAGIPITVLRCFNLIGPGEPASQASSEFARAAIEAGVGGRAEVRVGEPATARDFTDVRDAAAAIALALEAETTGTFNLCSGRATSLARLAETIGDQAGVRLTLVGSGTGRPASGLPEVSGSNDRLREATGWEPRIGLESSVGDLLKSLRS